MTGLLFLLTVGFGTLNPSVKLQSSVRNGASETRHVQHSSETLRDELSRTLAAISLTTSIPRQTALFASANAIARQYRLTWNDPFLVHKVALFKALKPADRRAIVVIDSLRRAGIVALGSEGVPRAMQLWRESLHRAAILKEKSVIAPSLVAIGAGFYRNGDLDSATAYAERGRAIAQLVGDHLTRANAVGLLASICANAGDAAKALALYKEASAIRGKIGDTRGKAGDDNNIGLLARERGDASAARSAFLSALAINQRDGRRKLSALNLANLAGVASDMRDYARADTLFATALTMQKQTGDEAESAFTLHNYARLQIRRGDYEDALASLAEALRVDDKTGAAAEAVSVLGDIAIVENAIGHPEKAIVTLQQAEQRARATRLPGETRAEIAIAKADLSFEFGNYAGAEASYALAERLFKSIGELSRAADARYGRATVQYQRGDYEQALRLSEQSQLDHLRAGDTRSAALTMLLKASIQQTRGDVAGARRTTLDAQRILHSTHDSTGEASTLVMLGNLDLTTGAERKAEAAYKEGLSTLGRARATDIRWRLHAGLAMALRKLGDLEGSAKHFREAIGMAESVAARMGVPARRFGFLTDKWSTYAELSLLEQTRGRASEAFAVSERLRAREMVDMLSRGRFGPLHTLTALEQDYRRRVDEIAFDLEPSGNENSALREPVRLIPRRDIGQTRLVQAQTEYARVLNEIRATNPDYVNMVSASTVSGRDVSRHLGSDEVLLEYLLGDSSCVVFVVTRDTLVALRLPVSRESLADLVAFTRHSLEKPDDSKSRPLWNPPLERMYRELIDPVEKRGYLAGKRRLVIVPHGDLHFLSFAALQSPRTHRFLIEQFEIGYAPSATVWMQLRNRKPVARTRRILAMAPHINELPASRNEVGAIGNIYGKDAIVLTGANASESTLRSNLARVGIIHLATFGIMNKRNPLFSFVRLARTNGSDGRLEVNKVYGLGMNGQLVILSACQTALGSGINGDMPPGDDWVGLVQAFLQGGAGGVLASLWPVDDSSTSFLMQRFHKRLASGVDPVSAIAAAQREMIRKTETHMPFYWAAFVINGDGYGR